MEDATALSLENRCQLEKLRLCHIATNVQEEVSAKTKMHNYNYCAVVPN